MDRKDLVVMSSVETGKSEESKVVQVSGRNK